MDIYAYFNVQQLSLLIDAIAAFTSSSTFMDLVKLIVMLGFIILVAGIALGKDQDPFEFFRWLMTVAIITTVLLVPKVDVVLVDRTGSNPPVAKANVPIGFAFFASVTSHVGDYLTRGFETIFALPTDLQFQKNGIMFGNTVLTESLKVGITTPALQKDMIEFVNSCTYYDIIAGRIDGDALSSSTDIWAGLSNTSVTLLTPYSGSATGSFPCDAAYAALTTRLTAEVNKQQVVLGRKLNPSAINNAAASALIGSQLANSYQTLTTISQTATDILRQNMMANTFRTSQMSAAQRLDDNASAVIGAAQAEAEISANTNYLVMARIAERAAPAIRNTVEIIIYAVFPIILIMMLVAPMQSATIFKNYVLTMLWVQIIPALYAVMNFVMVSASYVKLKGIVDGYSTTAVTMQSMGDISQQGLSDMAMGGYLTLLIPAIAYGIVKTGEIGGAAIFSSAMGAASGAAAAASSALTKGNIDQGLVNVDNQNMNNRNMNKSDVSSSISSGFNRVTNAQGTATFGNDASNTYRQQSNVSTLGLDASFGQKVANSYRDEASNQEGISNRTSVQAAKSTSAALSDAMSLVKDYQKSHGTATDWGTGKGADAARTVAKYAAVEKRVAEALGADFDKSIAKDIVTATTTNGGAELSLKSPGGSGIALGAGLNTSDASTAHKAKKLSAAFSIAAAGVSNISADERKGAVENFKYSQAYQEGERNNNVSARNFNANKTNADTFTETAEQAKTKAQSLNQSASVLQDNWATMSTSLSTYAADVIQKMPGGGMSTFNSLLQTNPDAAAKMYAQAISGIAPGLAPTRPTTTSLAELTSDTPLGKTLEAGTGPAPTNTTGGAFQNYKAEVRAKGWNEQTPSGSSLKPIVKNEIQSANDIFIATRNQLETNTNDRKDFVTPLVQHKSMNLTPNNDGSNPNVDTALQIARDRANKK